MELPSSQNFITKQKDLKQRLESVIENKWYEYRDKAYRKIALDWLDANNIKYEE